MKFSISPDGEYKLVKVQLKTSRHEFGIVELILEDVHTGCSGSMNMAIMDWQRIGKQVNEQLAWYYKRGLEPPKNKA